MNSLVQAMITKIQELLRRGKFNFTEIKASLHAQHIQFNPCDGVQSHHNKIPFKDIGNISLSLILRGISPRQWYMPCDMEMSLSF